MRLLRGVLQPPFKDRKDPEYFNRMKKAQLLARGGNENSGTEGDHGDDFDETTLDAIRRRNKVQPMARDDGKVGKKDKLSYEAKLREMNLNANQFNFYAIDKPN